MTPVQAEAYEVIEYVERRIERTVRRISLAPMPEALLSPAAPALPVVPAFIACAAMQSQTLH